MFEYKTPLRETEAAFLFVRMNAAPAASFGHDRRSACRVIHHRADHLAAGSRLALPFSSSTGARVHRPFTSRPIIEIPAVTLPIRDPRRLPCQHCFVPLSPRSALRAFCPQHRLPLPGWRSHRPSRRRHRARRRLPPQAAPAQQAPALKQIALTDKQLDGVLAAQRTWT